MLDSSSDDDVTTVGSAPEPEPVVTAPVEEPPAAPKRKRRLWPTREEDWTTRDDQRIFRTIDRLLKLVPVFARRRVRNYILEAFSQTTIEERLVGNPPGASSR